MSGTSGVATEGWVPTFLLQFVHRLREADVPVSMVEMLDAVEAVRRIDPVDREQFRTSLAATLVKRVQDLPAFNSLFDIYFAVQRGGHRDIQVETTLDRAVEGEAGATAHEVIEGEEAEEPSTDLLRMLLQALRSDD